MKRTVIEDAPGGSVVRYEGICAVRCLRPPFARGEVNRLQCTLTSWPRGIGGPRRHAVVADVDEADAPGMERDGDPDWPDASLALASCPQDAMTCYVEQSEELVGPYRTIRCVPWDRAADYELKRMPLWTGEAAAQAMGEFVGRLLGRR